MICGFPNAAGVCTGKLVKQTGPDALERFSAVEAGGAVLLGPDAFVRSKRRWICDTCGEHHWVDEPED